MSHYSLCNVPHFVLSIVPLVCFTAEQQRWHEVERVVVVRARRSERETNAQHNDCILLQKRILLMIAGVVVVLLLVVILVIFTRLDPVSQGACMRKSTFIQYGNIVSYAIRLQKGAFRTLSSFVVVLFVRVHSVSSCRK